MTDHPCKGMTTAQIRGFELIAINEHPRCGAKTIEFLKRRGLIVDGPPKILRDRFGTFTFPTWTVPIALHAQWCEWAAENHDENGKPLPGADPIAFMFEK